MKLNSKLWCVNAEEAGELEQWLLEKWSERVPWVQWMCPTLQTWKQRYRFAQMDYRNWRFPSALVSAHYPSTSAQLFLCQIPVWRHFFEPVPVIFVLFFMKVFLSSPNHTASSWGSKKLCRQGFYLLSKDNSAVTREKKNLFECEVVRYIVGMGPL